MIRILPILVLAGCSFTGGNLRPVGAIDASITDAPGLARLELHNVAGTVEIAEADQVGARVDVEVLLAERRPESDFQPEFARYVDMERNGDTLTIRSRHAGRADSGDWQLRYRVRVPAGIAVAVDQVAGTVDLRLPRTGDVTIGNVAGTVTLVVPAVDGKVAVTARTGTIHVDIAERGPSGGCSLDCTSGTITLRLPSEAVGDFDLTGVTGNIDIAPRFGIATQRSMASVAANGTIGTGGPRYRAHVVTGSIDVR